MSNKYQFCLEASQQLGHLIHQKLGREGDATNRIFSEFPDPSQFEHKNFVVILGLNRSYKDNPSVAPTLFNYIPELSRHENDLIIRQKLKNLKLDYEKYFKTFYQIFGKFGYNPLWFNKEILVEIVEDNNNKKYFDKHALEYLSWFNSHDNGNYIIIADLLPYAETNSKFILPVLEEKSVLGKQTIHLLKIRLQAIVEMIKPKMVLVANAAVSDFITKYFSNNNAKQDLKTSIDIFKAPFVLASMLTGGVMDKYSRQRLINEISTFL